MKSSITIRLWFLSGVFALIALIIVGKLYEVQFVKHEYYSLKADHQYASSDGDIFDRGSIFFETKGGSKVSAASIKEGYLLIMVPKDITDIESAYSAISKYVKLDKDFFTNSANKKASSYVELAKHVDLEIGKNISDLEITGIRVQKERWRFYPGNELASHSLGYYGFGSDKLLSGQYGLEKYYEGILTRKDDGESGNFIAEIFSNFKKTVVEGEELSGDVISSIEPTVQYEFEKILTKAKAQWLPDLIGGVIIDPVTGQIYAIGALPNYNPNSYGSASNTRAYTNPLVQDRYELGSIMKPLTMAIGLDTGAITPSSTYKDEGFIKLNGYTVRNYDAKARGVIPMQEILSQSLNVGAAYIALKTDPAKFSQYFHNLGMSVETGIDQPYEIKGDIKNVSSNRDVERVTASFGQGIAITPIEMVRALSALANGGLLVKPHIANKIEYRVGTEKVIDGGEPVRIFKKETTDAVTKMLVKVVDESLKKGTVKMDRWSMAAKTGTAQIADPAKRGYYSDRYLHSFFGYFPAEKPRFLIFLYQVYPKGAEYASETLTDPYIQMAKFLITYYEIPPDR